MSDAINSEENDVRLKDSGNNEELASEKELQTHDNEDLTCENAKKTGRNEILTCENEEIISEKDEITETEDNPQEAEIHKCANCGTESSGNFCPNCGQSMMVGRVKASSLYRQTISSVFRLDPLFLRTVWKLVTRPWKVIKDYLEGHQVCYMAPMTTLVFLFFFKAILNSILGVGSGESLQDIWHHSMGLPPVQETIIKLGKTLIYIDIITLILLRIPMILAVKTVYSRLEKDKYNWAEYATASVYMLSAVTAVSILTDILITPFFGNEVSDMIQSLYSCVFIFLVLHKIFPHKSLWASIRRYMFTMFLGVLFYVIYFITIVLIVALVLYTADPTIFADTNT